VHHRADAVHVARPWLLLRGLLDRGPVDDEQGDRVLGSDAGEFGGAAAAATDDGDVEFLVGAAGAEERRGGERGAGGGRLPQERSAVGGHGDSCSVRGGTAGGGVILRNRVVGRGLAHLAAGPQADAQGTDDALARR